MIAGLAVERHRGVKDIQDDGFIVATQETNLVYQ